VRPDRPYGRPCWPEWA